MDMGEKISVLRKEKGMTLEQLGDLVGVGKSTVRKWENGMIANMRRDKISKIADALGVSPGYLMGWDNNVLEDHPAADPAPCGAPPPPDLSDREAELVRRYRFIDDIGKNRVDVNLNLEYDRCAAERGNASSA